MCFSETGSFTAAGLLAIMSVFSLKAAKKKTKYIPLALIPLFFGIQQFFEGVEWHLFNAGRNVGLFKYFYTFFSFSFWPFWIPFSLYFAEDIPIRKTTFGILSFLGVALGIYNYYHVITYPVHAEVVKNSIQYTIGIPGSTIWPYFFLTIFPWFLSSLKGTTILGIIVALSAAAATYFYYDAFTSVWCLFSALISGLVIITLNIQKKI